MRRRRLLGLSVLAATGTAGAGPLLSGCGGGDGARPRQASTAVKVGDNFALDPEITAERHFGERLTALTGGRFTVEVFPDGVLGDTSQMNEAVRRGSLQVTKCLTGKLSAYDQRLGALSMPYAFDSQDALFTALDGELGGEVARLVQSFDMVLLGLFTAGERNVYTVGRAVREPADLAGLRIRVPDDVVAVDAFIQCGARVTALPSNDTTPAFQAGAIDGAENNIIQYIGSGHAAHAPYYSLTRHQFGVDALLASERWFTDLPSRDRDAVVQAGQEAVTLERRLWREQAVGYTDRARAANVRFTEDVDLAAFRRAVRSVLDRRRSSFGELARFLPV